jgi:uncharacterized membrane protein YbhN (UPF0104 family)
MTSRPGGGVVGRGILHSMSMLTANLLCVALVALDLAVRGWRIQWILQGTQCRITFLDALTLNAVGDAAAAVTPNRIGAEPARLGGAMLSRVPLAAGVVAIAIETLVMGVTTIAAAVWLAVLYAPEWWRTAGPALEDTIDDAWPFILAMLAAGLLAWWAVRRFAPALSHSMRRGSRRAWVYARRMPRWPLVAAAITSVISIAARVAILPVLAATLPHPPPLGPLCFASFGLVYGQMLLPTPSGAGVVELGFLGGAVGNLGAGYKPLLLLWRFYTTVLLIAEGVALGLWRYGPGAVRAIVRGRAGPVAVRVIVPEEAP